MTARLVVDGLNVLFTRKDITAFHIHVRPPDGTVEITGPLWATDGDAASNIRLKRAWINEAILRVTVGRGKPFTCVTGDTVHLWGKPLQLIVKPAGRASVRQCGGVLFLSCPADATQEQRIEILDKWYKGQLKEAAEARFPILQQRSGLYCLTWSIRKMTSRWGSCRMPKRAITLNLRLAHKPPECLDAVILHELAHTVHMDHSAAFWRLLGRICPDYRRTDQLLNDHETDI